MFSNEKSNERNKDFKDFGELNWMELQSVPCDNIYGTENEEHFLAFIKENGKQLGKLEIIKEYKRLFNLNPCLNEVKFASEKILGVRNSDKGTNMKDIPLKSIPRVREIYDKELIRLDKVKSKEIPKFDTILVKEDNE